MYRVPVINFIDKIDKFTEVVIIDEETNEKIDHVHGEDNREYKLDNLDGWYVAKVVNMREGLIMITAYQYPKN